MIAPNTPRAIDVLHAIEAEHLVMEDTRVGLLVTVPVILDALKLKAVVEHPQFVGYGADVVTWQGDNCFHRGTPIEAYAALYEEASGE